VRPSSVRILGTSREIALGRSEDTVNTRTFRRDGYTFVEISGSTALPKLPAAAIDFTFTVVLDSKGGVVAKFGRHDPFPHHGASVQVEDEKPTTILNDAPGVLGGLGLLPPAPDGKVQ
jgi:hypothetical protein